MNQKALFLRRLRFLSSVLIFLFPLACRQPSSGFLLVNSLKNGEYEVYKILGDSSLQFVSIQIGQLNTKLALQPGNYLVLGDCSYQIVLIHPKKTTELTAHSLKFIPPLEPKTDDIFSIQCHRYPQTHPPQNINHRFELTLFPGVMDMLVGMRPMKLDLSKQEFKTPRELIFDLSALRVSPASSHFPVEVPPYFISPADGQLAITQSQSFGQWQFLLPGTYIVTVNGTQKELTVRGKESISIDPSYLKFATSTAVDIDRYQAIKGEPYTAEINDHRAFTVNTIYPLISDSISYRLEGATKAEALTLEPGTLTSIPLRSVEVSLNCGPWEWECLGKRDISLFEPDSSYPFLHGNTDLPILFAKDDVQIEIEGAQNLRYKIPHGKRDLSFETGQLLLKAKPTFKHGQITLLVRVDGDNNNVMGQSYDIPYTRETRIHLIIGTYSLSHFYTVGAHSQNGGIQMSTRTSLTVKKGEVREFGFEYYLPEDKFEAYSQGAASTVRSKPGNKDRSFTIF